MTLSKTSRVYFPLFLFIFFPYIKLLPSESDTQPWAALFATIIFIFFLYDIRNRKISICILFSFCFSIVLLLCKTTPEGFRDFFGYFSVFIIYHVLNDYYKKHVFNVTVFHVITLLWIIVGVIQLFIPGFLTFLISAARTTKERGVTSLAVEPSYFGIVLQYFLLINVVFNGGKKYNILYSIAIVCLAQSMMAILYLLVFWSLFFINRNKKIFILICLFLAIGSSVVVNYKSENRALSLSKQIVKKGPVAILKLDESINDRIGSIYFSFSGFIKNNGFPRLFGSYAMFKNAEMAYQNLFYGKTDRIMCTIGSILFYLGVFGLPLVIKMMSVILKIDKTNRFFILVFMFLFYLTAIPLSFPFIGLIMALFNNYSNQIESKELIEK